MSRYDQPGSDDRDLEALSGGSPRRSVPCRHCGTPVDVDQCPPPTGLVCANCYAECMATQFRKMDQAQPTHRRQHVPNCGYCARYRPTDMFPPHDASRRCESGQRDHCTCATCF